MFEGTQENQFELRNTETVCITRLSVLSDCLNFRTHQRGYVRSMFKCIPTFSDWCVTIKFYRHDLFLLNLGFLFIKQHEHLSNLFFDKIISSKCQSHATHSWTNFVQLSQIRKRYGISTRTISIISEPQLLEMFNLFQCASLPDILYLLCLSCFSTFYIY